MLIGTLLLCIILASTVASYRGVKESALEVGNQRLQNLTKQLSNLLQQSAAAVLAQTFTVANDPAIRAVLQSPSPTTRSAASATLEQFRAPKDPLGFQVELWDTQRSLVLSQPNGALPVAADLETEFKASSVEPFKSAGPMHLDKNAIVVPIIAAVKDELGKPLGYLVRWRRISLNPPPKQLSDLIGSDAALYFGNSRGDIFTNLERIVAKPQPSVGSTLDIMHYSRDGNRVMAHARPIVGTPWFVLVEFPEQPFMTQANRFLRRMVIIGAALLALGIAGAFLLSRNITRPLRALTEAASAISAGDDSHTVEVQRDDELGALASAFNTMVATRRNSQRELERKVQERTLQLEAAPCAMLMVDQEGRIALVNAQAERLFGYDRSELLEQPIEKLVPKRYRTAHPGHRRLFSQHPTARSMGAGRDLFGLCKDGSEIPIEIGLNPITTERGDFVLASIIDITGRKRAEARFRLVVEASPSAMLMVNEEGRITLVNAQAEQLFGYSRTELLEQRIEALVPERFRSPHPGHRTGFFQHPTARTMGAGRDLFGLRRDGTEVPIEIGLNPIRTDEGAFVLASIIDITERKRSEQKFQQVIENAPNGMVMIDQKGKITLVNAQIEKSFGYSRDELLGEPIEVLVPPRFRAHHSKYRDGFIANPTVRPMGIGRNLFGLRKDGSEFPVEIGLNPLQTEQGVMVLGTIVDITERKQAEEKLRRSQEQLGGVIGSAMDAIITVDEDQTIILFNAAAEKMFRTPVEDAMGQSIERFIPERFRPNHKSHIQDFGRTHVTRRSMGSLGAIFGLRAGGEEFPIEASISQIVSEGRKLHTVILRDITERKRAEEALREQAQMLDLAHVLIRDMNDQIIFWNTGSEQMYGWRSEEALGKVSHELLRTEYPQDREEIKARLLTRGHWEGEVVHRRRDRGRIVVASHWILHRDDEGEPKAVLEVNNDITELKQAEEEIRRFSEKLEQRVEARTAELQASNAELEAFSYSVSHDLRAPLRHLSGFADMLNRKSGDSLDETGKRYLETILESANRMGKLIDHLLAFSRLGRADMQTALVNLDQVLASALTDLKTEADEHDVVWSIDKLPPVSGDAALLRMVFVNLISNALKFSRDRHPAEIRVGSTQNNGEVTVFVRDNGAGFDMKYAEKLFGVFQRLHRAEQFEGTGIGLANVRRIILRHGGKTWAESKNGDGATFYFSLPVAEKGNGNE